LGALLAALAVVLGAFGAHLLKAKLAQWYPEEDRATELLATWETGVRYQLYSAVGIIVAGLWGAQRAGRRPTLAVACLLLGTLLFSGMLYAWVLTAAKPLVAVVPIGGVAMISGWLVFAWQARLGTKSGDSA
jgi:uncharacterized membrane protein YgdD (TMEM256/DUF423 family)